MWSRSQQLAELLELPTDGMTEDPATPKGEQTSYNGVYILQQLDNAPKKSRFATREQASNCNNLERLNESGLLPGRSNVAT